MSVTQQIVIVDDDDLHLKLLRGIAGDVADVTVHAFTSSQEAIEWIPGQDIDCFVFDYNMPSPDGLEMIALVRAMDRFAGVPIIMVTGTQERDVRYRALDAGATDFVTKPVDRREMTARLTTLLALQEMRKGLSRQVDTLGGSLREEEERSRQHAERLEAMWQIVNNSRLGDVDMWLAMLDQAASAIRPGQAFRGMLARVDGPDLVVEAIANAPELGSRPGIERTPLGGTTPIAGTVFGHVLDEGGGTRSWRDLRAGGAGTERLTARGWRSMLITTFAAGGAMYVLSFVSSDVVADDFGVQDRTYIQILAAFFANHLQQRWQAERIQYQQAHDTLTGLLNRSQFRSQARLASLGAKSYSLILLDINAFHEINESYGHMTGDSLLLEVATALRDRVGATEILGRVGGNTFGVYVPEQLSSEEVTRRARDLGGVFAGGFSTGDREGREFIGLTASLGIATAPEHGDGIDAIFSHADAALLAAKDRGPASIVVFAPGMEGEAQRRAALRSQLTSAVTRDQFVLYFQPHVDIETGRVTGAEALIRWQHPERGLLAPGLFIPFAEQTGLITTIDAWVMRNAFVAAKALAEIDPEFRLYFNLSGRQAGDTQIVRAFSEAARNGVSLTNIGIEITESDAMRDVELTRRVCRALRRIGVRIAIDDFGTGYSSLSFLKLLPVDIVKIDRSFVSGVLTDPHDELIAETIISITQRFGFESLAEGVEDVREIAWLRGRGCNLVQGFEICRPIPIDEFKTWLIAHQDPAPP